MMTEEAEQDPGVAFTTSIGSDSLELAVTAGDTGVGALVESGVLGDVPFFDIAWKLYKVGRDVRDHLYQRKIFAMLSQVLDHTTRTQRRAFAEDEVNRDKGERLGETLLLLIDKADETPKAPLIGRIMAACIRGDLDRSKAVRICAMIVRAYYPDLELLRNFRYGTGAPKQSIFATLAAVGFLDHHGDDGGTYGSHDPHLRGGAILALNEYAADMIRFGFLITIDLHAEVTAAEKVYDAEQAKGFGINQ